MTGEYERELTVDLMNAALLPVSQEHGYCLCIHPMMDIINMFGTACMWCEQPVPEDAMAPELKVIRTEAVKAAYPWARQEERHRDRTGQLSHKMVTFCSSSLRPLPWLLSRVFAGERSRRSEILIRDAL